MKTTPCKKCGGTDVKLTDCNYSSFNVGMGKCQGCGFKIKFNHLGCNPTQNHLRKRWNEAQELTETETLTGKLKAERLKCRRLRVQLRNAGLEPTS